MVSNVINETAQEKPIKEHLLLSPLSPIERQRLVNLITHNLMECGIILPREIPGYSKVLRAYDDVELSRVKDFSVDLRVNGRLN